jgi:hypothetical protein
MGRIVTVSDGAGWSVKVSNWGGGTIIKALGFIYTTYMFLLQMSFNHFYLLNELSDDIFRIHVLFALI